MSAQMASMELRLPRFPAAPPKNWTGTRAPNKPLPDLIPRRAQVRIGPASELLRLTKMKVAVALLALSALVGAFVPHPGARLHRPPSTALAGVADDRIDELVKANKIMLFMKGTKMFPQCGFSNTVVQVLTRMGVEFETFDVLSDDAIRQGIKEYSNWPTIPQLYLDGEFVGGCDIVIEQYQNGELQEAIEIAMAS